MTRLLLAILVGCFLASLVTACAYSLARWYTRYTPLPPPSSVVLAPCPHCGHPEALADRFGPPCVPALHDGVGVAGGGGVRAGTRVRMKPTIAWPERAGCEGVVVVAPNGPGVYPDDPRDKNRVLVLLDDDPLGSSGWGPWTCAVSRSDVEVLP